LKPRTPGEKNETGQYWLPESRQLRNATLIGYMAAHSEACHV